MGKQLEKQNLPVRADEVQAWNDYSFRTYRVTQPGSQTMSPLMTYLSVSLTLRTDIIKKNSQSEFNLFDIKDKLSNKNNEI